MENLSFDGLESLFTAMPSKRNDAAFQVLLYAYLYRRKFPDNPVIPCLVFSRKSYKPDFSWHLKDQSDHTEVLEFTRYEKLFGERLKSSLEELIDPTLPFIQTSDEDFCAVCLSWNMSPVKRISHESAAGSRLECSGLAIKYLAI